MKAIGWTLADIKGINPSTVMHQILMEDGVKLTIDAQRRLNSPIKEVVRKEVVKWLNVGVGYPISNINKWEVQCILLCLRKGKSNIKYVSLTS
ncbi:hypothetical protein CsatA_004296 [Cannabis sativa]